MQSRNRSGIELASSRVLNLPFPGPARDMGTIVMGKGEAGVVKKGDTLLVMPNK
jgi:peptide chain release factor subunit 3